MLDRFIYAGGKFFLAVAVWEWKRKRLNGSISLFLPVKFVARPWGIQVDQIPEPRADLFTAVGNRKTTDLLALQMAVRHLNGDKCRIFGFADHIGIAHCLRFMHQKRFF